MIVKITRQPRTGRPAVLMHHHYIELCVIGLP